MPATVKKDGIIFSKANDGKHKYKAITPNGTRYFGALYKANGGKYQHFYDKIGMYRALDHNDTARRQRYRARHSKIFTKDGKPAYRVKYSAAWLSYYYLW